MDRTRRLRQTAVMRSMVRENHVRTEELIYPLFVMEGKYRTAGGIHAWHLPVFR